MNLPCVMGWFASVTLILPLGISGSGMRSSLGLWLGCGGGGVLVVFDGGPFDPTIFVVMLLSGEVLYKRNISF